MGVPRFTRTVIGELENEIGRMNTLFNVGDLNADGRPDVFTSGRSGRMAWFENKGDGRWERHIVNEVVNQECGGLAYDLNHDGWPDIINGGDWQSDELAWWENPGPKGGPWTRRVITRTGAGQFHDELIGDVTGDGVLSLVFWNQFAGALSVVPLPEDPTLSPWPGIHTIARDMKEKNQPEEGLALYDIDGDGQTEIIAGTHWYKYVQGAWEQYKFAADYITTLIAVGDIDGDGKPEIVLSEGDACIYGYPQGGKLGWFKPKGDLREMWEEHRIDENLLDPHSLQIADLCGNGRLDLLVGEIGKRETLAEEPPRLMIYENDGSGRFTRHVIDQGIGTHHARLADLRGTGRRDIVSRPLHGADKWKIFAWYNGGVGPS
jgi:hypothetical protein